MYIIYGEVFMRKDKFISVAVDRTLREWIQAQAVVDRRSISEYVRIVLEDYMYGKTRELAGHTPHGLAKTGE
jgi:hypothetical protein